MDLVNRAGSAETVVNEKNTAVAVGSGNFDVFSTPMMVALMEEAAVNAVAPALDENQSSVGINISVDHVAASLLGKKISAKAVVLSAEGKIVKFQVTAYEGEKLIGSGSHTRAIVGSNFVKKLLEKEIT